MAIKGYAFLSGRWGELIFQKVFDGQAPHFISGKPIETDCCNDNLAEFAFDIDADPSELADAIFVALEEVTFVFPACRLVGENTIVPATGYHYQKALHSIKLAC